MTAPLPSSRVLRVLATIPLNARQELRVQLEEMAGKPWVKFQVWLNSDDDSGDSTPFTEPLWMSPDGTKQLIDGLMDALETAQRYAEGRRN